MIEFMEYPLMWVSKLKTQADLNTMESKYISLSHSMRDCITIKGGVQEISDAVFMKKVETQNINTHS